CRGKPAADFNIIQRSLPVLVNYLSSNDKDILADCLWTLSYITNGPNYQIVRAIEAGVSRFVVELMSNPSKDVFMPALRVAANIVTAEDRETGIMINLGIVPKLKKLLQTSSNRTIQKEVCFALSNIPAGDSS